MTMSISDIMAAWDEQWQESEPVAAASTSAATTSASASFSDPRAGPSHNSRIYRPSAGGYNRGTRGRSNETNWRDRADASERTRRYYRHEEGNKRIIFVPSHRVGRIIGKAGAKIRDLEDLSQAKIRIGESSGNSTDITLIGTDEAILKVEGMINEVIKEYRPAYSREGTAPKESYHKKDADHSVVGKELRDNSVGKEGREIKKGKGVKGSTSLTSSSSTVSGESNTQPAAEVFDWHKLNAYYDRQHNDTTWDDLPKVVKNLYEEHSTVAAMSAAEVIRWRRANCDIQANRTFKNKPGLRPMPNPVLSFEQAFHPHPEILESLHKQEFKLPTPFQSQAWPIILSGEDMIGISQNGTGKTLSYLLPALIHIDGQTTPREKREGPSVLIMTPTRELVLQTEKEVSKYQYKEIKSVSIYGGGDRKEQIKMVSDGVDMVIGTPGRLNDLVLAGHLEIINFSYIVLDEADKMLEMGFELQIQKTLSDVRPDCQIVMISATWPEEVRRIAEFYMKDPIQVHFGPLHLATLYNVIQRVLILEENDKENALFDFLHCIDPSDKVIIFCGKKATATHISTMMAIRGINSQCIHTDQDQTECETVLSAMSQENINILVASDVASKEIDIHELSHVVNHDFPKHVEEYVHRVSRAGRAGKKGIALSFVTQQDWANARNLVKILQEASQEVPDDLEIMAQRFEAMKLKRDIRGRGGGIPRPRRGRWQI